MKKFFAALVLASLTIVFVSTGANPAGEKKDKEPEFTIGEVMKKAHLSKLFKKVADGDASAEEKKQLVGFYLALHANTPKKGEEKEWKTMTKELVDTAKAVLDGKEGAGEKLAKLVNCGACHKKFKG